MRKQVDAFILKCATEDGLLMDIKEYLDQDCHCVGFGVNEGMFFALLVEYGPPSAQEKPTIEHEPFT